MSLQLLFVEDNDKTREKLLELLKRLPVEVTVAHDGLGALNKASQHTFDFVLSDHKMPLMDGMTLFKNLSQMPQYQSVPLVLMTTAALVTVQEQAEQVHAWQVLPKPIDQEHLARLILSVVNREKRPWGLTEEIG